MKICKEKVDILNNFGKLAILCVFSSFEGLKYVVLLVNDVEQDL
jgi:hypothetical protein